MKKLFVSALLGLLFSAPSFANVDLWSSAEQTLSPDVSERLFQSLATGTYQIMDPCDPAPFTINIKNLYCEIAGYNTANPKYKCSYGLNDEITGESAKNIYQAMVQAGFESDCDKHDGTCDIDPVSRMTCERSSSVYFGTEYSCTLVI